MLMLALLFEQESQIDLGARDEEDGRSKAYADRNQGTSS